MKIIQTIADMRTARNELAHGSIMGLVPTMGALHEGHRSLIRAARGQCDAVAVSIFVNPTQFAVGEDLSRYPRTFAEDCAVLEEEGVNLLFAPGISEMYGAAGARTFVEVSGIGERLDGASRPGHFRGVATVVAKLFHIVTPQVAYFGQKDAAQVAVLRAMVKDLDFGVKLVICPIVRDADGLALSSRNRYLTADERVKALSLSRALQAATALVQRGENRVERIREVMLATLTGLRVDYATVVDPETLEDVDEAREGSLIAVAAWVGTTRLIDNVVIGS